MEEKKQIQQVTWKECPSLFDDITEYSINSDMDHRRGATFYRTETIEFKPEHSKYYPEITNFEDYVGTWITNTVVWDDNQGWDENFSVLIRLPEPVKPDEYTRVAIVQDESGHDYIIPYELKEEFDIMLEDSYVDEIQEGYFEAQFGQYMVGGDPNEEGLYILKKGG